MQHHPRIGFFGGSLDPIHHGHLLAAQDAVEQLSLETLYFVPSAQAPLRDEPVRASAKDRVEMIRLAIAGIPSFQISEIEIDRGGVSYTVDTVAELKKARPDMTLVWIIGQDQLAKLPQWRRIEELCALTEFAYFQRPGHDHPIEPRIPGLRLHRLQSRQIGISSTEIRQRTREKRPLHFLLPAAVIDYIYERNLYR